MPSGRLTATACVTDNVNHTHIMDHGGLSQVDSIKAEQRAGHSAVQHIYVHVTWYRNRFKRRVEALVSPFQLVAFHNCRHHAQSQVRRWTVAGCCGSIRGSTVQRTCTVHPILQIMIFSSAQFSQRLILLILWSSCPTSPVSRMARWHDY